MSGWRRITTNSLAKDGCPCLLSCRSGITGDAFVCEGYYDYEQDGWWAANTHHTDHRDGQVFPTHWQPLPQPHKAKEGDTP